MASNEMYVITPSAFEAVDGLVKIALELFCDKSITIQVSTSLNPLSVNFQSLGKDLPSNKSYLQFVEKVKNRPHIQITSASITISSGNGRIRALYLDQNNNVEQSSVFRFDNESGEYVDLQILLSDGLAKYLRASTRPSVIASNLPKAERHLLKRREESIASLDAAVAMIGKFNLEQIQRQTEQLNKLTSELERKYQEREKKLEEKAQRQQDELIEKIKQFEIEKAAFDDRDRTHVRRALLDKLNAIIEEQSKRIDVAAETVNKRRIIHIVCWILIAFSGILAAGSAFKTLTSSTFDWHYAAPLASSMLLMVSTVIYYLRWTNHWFTELAQAEFAIRKLKADVTRATWVAELFFEYKDERQVSLPAPLIESLTQGLFEPVHLKPGAHHPADQILGFLKKIGTVKISPNEVELSCKSSK